MGFGECGVWTALGDGNGGFAPPRVVDDFGYSAGGWRVDKHPRFVADVTGDGRADIVGFGDAGVWVSRNNGYGAFRTDMVVPNFGYTAGGWRVDKHPRMLADLTGDGRADIVGFGDAGAGSPSTTAPAGSPPATLAVTNFAYTAGGWRVENHPRLLADVTGDGRADIVGFGDAGVWVSRNNGYGTFADPTWSSPTSPTPPAAGASTSTPASSPTSPATAAPTSSASATPASGSRSTTATAGSPPTRRSPTSATPPAAGASTSTPACWPTSPATAARTSSASATPASGSPATTATAPSPTRRRDRQLRLPRRRLARREPRVHRRPHRRRPGGHRRVRRRRRLGGAG